jgi:UDP-N-acetylglucosamine--N-acetylmuramyl-(pentapeptide) pyrophosphoryl-undecaprenol N-acetylglucosamine transferase
VFCFGGSLGARAVNDLVVSAMRELGDRVDLVHQTGKDDAERVAAAYREAGVTADVRPFIDDMAAEYGRADLVIARAGATTVAELTTVGRPAILIPYPFAADNHQERNGAALSAAGAAVVLRQSDLDGRTLAAAIRELLDDPDRLGRMQSAMKALGMPQAAETIVSWATSQRKA